MLKYVGGQSLLFASSLAVAACGSSGGSDADGNGGSAGQTGSAGAAGSAGSGGSAGAGGIQEGLEIAIESGVLMGADQGDTRAFRGIPFAAPPVGDLRWKPPEAVEPWTGVRDATQNGSACPQLPTLIGDLPTNEDCLYLNVWAPKEAPPEPVPVMVWIHGGAWALGSGAEPIYDGQRLVEHSDRVVVSINYRLAALGFLAHPALSAESNTGSSGNYWLLDQVAALEWVQRNILAFGGDPGNVTVFGESAGGGNVCALMASPLTTGLFHRAISQSGICGSGLFAGTLSTNEQRGEATAATLGCTDAANVLSCLRGQTENQLVGLLAVTGPRGGLFYAPSDALIPLPFADGHALPADTDARFASGDVQPVPLLIGTNGDESRVFHSSDTLALPVRDEPEYREALGRRFAPTDVDAIVAEYPIAAYPSPNEALMAVTDDAFFICPARRTARATARAGLSTYLYGFEHIREGATASDHGSEIALVFGQDDVAPADRALSDAMIGYWTRFAATGDPNGDGAVTWPAYDTTGDQHLELTDPIAARSGRESQKCDFWDGIQSTL